MAFRASMEGEAPIVTADAGYGVWRWLWWSDFEEAEVSVVYSIISTTEEARQ